MSSQENGVINGCGSAPAPGLHWKVGLINHQKKYLTAEKFGFKINASGTTLKTKQTWMLEQDTNDEVVYIRSHIGRYLSTDQKGNVTCEEEERGDTEKFVVEYAKDGSGDWMFRHALHGYYFGGTEDKIKCFAKTPSKAEQWTVQLSIHPQVNLRNVNRKRYAHLANDEIQFTEVIPWGADALIILDFVDGKYALKTCDNRYLCKDGTLVDQPSTDTCFTLEMKSGQNSGLAFKDCDGRYLTAVGSNATMRGRNKVVTKDELFTVSDSHPQVVVTAHNGKWVSVRQGVDVSANQSEEVTDKETFQIEFDKASNKWAVRTIDNKYWCLDTTPGSTGIQATAGTIKSESLFDIEWLGDGTAAIRASNNLYIFNKPTGHLTASSDTLTEKEKFKIRVVNRPLLVLKCEFGFVGVKQTQAQKSEYVCNKATYDVIFLESNDDGQYYLKGPNGKYWSISEGSMVFADSATPTPFVLELSGQSTFTIKAPNGRYLLGEQNGLFRAISEDATAAACQWEH